MTTFADSATLFINDRPDAATRRLAWSVFETTGLPTPSDEVWRYAPLGDLGLERFNVPSAPTVVPDSLFASELSRRAVSYTHLDVYKRQVGALGTLNRSSPRSPNGA